MTAVLWSGPLFSKTYRKFQTFQLGTSCMFRKLPKGFLVTAGCFVLAFRDIARPVGDKIELFVLRSVL